MLCPQCQQGVQTEELDAGACPYCGFPCRELDRRVNQVQLILAALFLSTLAFGIVVLLLEMWVDWQPTGLGDHEFIVGMALMGASVGIIAASIRFERRLQEQESIDTYSHMVRILGLIAEIPAIFGLVMYLLTGNLPWMVVFLLVCWIMLIRLGTRLPVILHGITDCLRTE